MFWLNRFGLVLGLVSVFALVGCDAVKGKDGPEGPTGPPGPQGPPGNANPAPKIFSVTPDTGSWRSFVTIDGEGFSDVDGGNEVYFDGELAEVIRAAKEQLVVRPTGNYVEEAETVDITVMTNDLASNAHAWTAVPSGTVLPSHVQSVGDIIDLTGNAAGDTLYAADLVAGLLTIDVATGRTTTLVPLSERLKRPMAVTWDAASSMLIVADDVTAAEDMSLMRLVSVDPTTGDVSNLTFPHPLFGRTIGLATHAATGEIYLLHDAEDALDDDTVSALDIDGNFRPSFATMGPDVAPMDIVVDAGNNLAYVSSVALDDLFSVDVTDGTVVQQGQDINLVAPQDMVFVAADDIRVLDVFGISSVDAPGGNFTPITTFATPTTFFFGEGLALDAAGAYHWGAPNIGANFDQVLMAPDADTLAINTQSAIYAQWGTTAAIGGELFFTDGYNCLAVGVLTGTFKIGIDGALERVAGIGCGFGVAATSAGALLIPDIVTGELFSFDPATSTATVILDLNDGIGFPYNVVVGPNDEVFTSTDVLAGVTAIAKSDAQGGNLTAIFAGSSLNFLYGGAFIDDKLVYYEDFVGLVELDPVAGGPEVALLTPYVEMGTMLSISRTPDDTIVGADIDFGTVSEINSAGVVWPVYVPTGDVATDPIVAPGAVATLPSGEYVVWDLANGSTHCIAP